jgi:N-acetylglucosaminyl-diphospho-decaprenol L-rhamnosyltransferase
MGPGEVELSVVLVNYNGATCLPATLAALATGTETSSVECLVVDSGSSDGSWKEVPRLWDRARVLRFDENIGFCAGCNRGAEAAAGRLLAFVNFDGAVETGWDAPLREMLADPTVSVATGLLLREDGETVEAAGLAIAPNMATYGILEGSARGSVPADPAQVAAASGALMMVRRDEFVALGGFYEPLFMYGEEADLCLRVPGRIVLHPGSAIRHEYGHASGPRRSRPRLYWGSRNRLVNAARHLPGWAFARAVLLSTAFDLISLAQLRRFDALRAVGAGWRDGLRRVRIERSARSVDERHAAARRLVSLAEALREQRRLGRL